MEEAARSRRAAREAISDVDPADLQEAIDDILADGSMAPGALTLLCASAIDDTVGLDSLTDRAAGVQLIYEGLRLTRRLAHEEPWARTDDHTQANVEVVAADVLVSRGFYLLARTEAAEKAVETVRRFGRAQTSRQGLAPENDEGAKLDATLEHDAFELAVMAGTTGVGSDPASLMGVADALAEAVGPPLPPAEECLPDPTVLRGKVTANRAKGSVDEPRSWITDP